MKNLSRLIPPLTIALLILGIAGCEPSEKMGGMTPDKRPPSGGAIGAYEGDVIDFAYSGGATGFADVNPSPGWSTPTSTDTAIPTSTVVAAQTAAVTAPAAATEAAAAVASTVSAAASIQSQAIQSAIAKQVLESKKLLGKMEEVRLAIEDLPDPIGERVIHGMETIDTR